MKNRHRYTMMLFVSIFSSTDAESDWSDPFEVRIIILGDMNDDGEVNAYDIDLFILALGEPEEYESLWGLEPDVVGDCNGDGVLNAYDINGFIQLVSGG